MSGLDHFYLFWLFQQGVHNISWTNVKMSRFVKTKTKKPSDSINWYFHELFRTDKSTKAESRLVVAWGSAIGDRSWVTANGYEIYLGDDDSVQEISLWRCDCWHTVNILRGTESWVVNGCISWCVNYISITLLMLSLYKIVNNPESSNRVVKRAFD